MIGAQAEGLILTNSMMTDCTSSITGSSFSVESNNRNKLSSQSVVTHECGNIISDSTSNNIIVYDGPCSREKATPGSTQAIAQIIASLLLSQRFKVLH